METNKSNREELLAFSLSKISKWQLDEDIGSEKISLPSLQRGFVWKANQIETLWDSILRGFPIGSFLLSRSDDKSLFLLDGQQRATSIAVGFYNPWIKDKENKFWSLKNIPVVWIDLMPKEKTNTQKFVIRVVTQSHPWGYQRKANNSILSVGDRRDALGIFQENPSNKNDGYTHLSLLNVFPYDSDLPVPLSFLITAISEDKENWKELLINVCKETLPDNIRTKHFGGDKRNFIERLEEVLASAEFDNTIIEAIESIEKLVIPAIVVSQEILKEDDEQSGEDPTLFVRLNSSGTKISGEELVYSIYKACFPETKELVENIGESFVAPSLVISLVSRLALSEINENSYPYSINIHDFRKKIKDEKFKNKLKELIGTKGNSPASNLFKSAFKLLRSENELNIPPILVKSIVKGSPDLFLLLLQWLKLHDGKTKIVEKNILGALTGLLWFGRDNVKFVRELWESTSHVNFWSKDFLNIPYVKKKDFIMYPLIFPTTLREYLRIEVVEKNMYWDDLYPDSKSEIIQSYKSILNSDMEQEIEVPNATHDMWDNFINKLFWCKPLVLFAQRKYINEKFPDFNQMETLEDTNTPWDWDHIYPSSWVYYKQSINPNTRHWTNSIGNFRAMSLEENRSENNRESPCDRLVNVREQSFIKPDNWKDWSNIKGRINEGDHEMIKNHLKAIINRFCDIYEEWYITLGVEDLFNFENENNLN